MEGFYAVDKRAPQEIKKKGITYKYVNTYLIYLTDGDYKMKDFYVSPDGQRTSRLRYGDY